MSRTPLSLCVILGVLANAHASAHNGTGNATRRVLQAAAVHPQAIVFKSCPTGLCSGPILTAIHKPYEHAWFSFQAQSQGQEFHIECKVGSSQKDLDDSNMFLVATDRKKVLAENDDDERDATTFGSYIEWTAPAPGTYFVEVKGYKDSVGAFTLSITATKPAAGQANDPCGGKAIKMTGSGVISHQPKGHYSDNRKCDWAITCSSGKVARFTFTKLNTAFNHDVVTVYDGNTGTGPALDRVSGSLVKRARRTFTASGPLMTLEFKSDAKQGAKGFEGKYMCVKLPANPPPPRTNGTATEVNGKLTTTGKPVVGTVQRASDHLVYAFPGVAGRAYQIQTQLGTLKDTSITLIDVDKSSIIVENDDADADSLGPAKASFIEWTCPATGTYYVMVRGFAQSTGTFQVSVKASGSAERVSSIGNPCRGGAKLTGAGILSYQPKGGYPSDAVCDWNIKCAHGHPSVRFTKFETENNKDFVVVYEGSSNQQSQKVLATESGNLVDLKRTQVTAQGSQLAIEFRSNGQTNAGGFVLAYTCHGTHGKKVPQPPPQTLPPTKDMKLSIQMCIDHIDDLYFQDSRIWLQYGGVWCVFGRGAVRFFCGFES